jgi:hypothetical protein
MSVFWLPLIYLLISIPFGIHEARSQLRKDLKNAGKGWYAGDGSPRRTEEERIRSLASENFWPGIGAGLMWPVTLIAFGIELVWGVSANAIASKEIKAARARAEEAKTQAILDKIKKDELAQFKELED